MAPADEPVPTIGELAERVERHLRATRHRASGHQTEGPPIASARAPGGQAIFLLLPNRLSPCFVGEPGGIRTRDPLIKSQVLYRLSYGLGMMGADNRRAAVRGQRRNGLDSVTLCYRNGSRCDKGTLDEHCRDSWRQRKNWLRANHPLVNQIQSTIHRGIYKVRSVVTRFYIKISAIRRQVSFKFCIAMRPQ